MNIRSSANGNLSPRVGGCYRSLVTTKQQNNKKAETSPAFSENRKIKSVYGLDVAGLFFTLIAIRNIERHFLSFLQGFKPGCINRREVREEVFATTIRRNKSITLGIVKPLDLACRHSLFLYQIEKKYRGSLHHPRPTFKSQSPKKEQHSRKNCQKSSLNQQLETKLVLRLYAPKIVCQAFVKCKLS
jgi:hypothetical protein